MRILVLGDLNLDIIAAEPGGLRRGDEARAPIRILPGGSAGTFARVAAASGASVRFVGSVGNDLVGELLIRSLEDAGVEAAVVRVDQPSGAVLSLTGEFERTMVCSRGANDGLRPEALAAPLFDGISHLHLSGYVFLSDAQRPSAHRAIRMARERNLTISVDPAPANLLESYGLDRMLDDLSSVDWLFPNLREGVVLTGIEDPEEIVAELSSRFSVGALTLGPDGALAWRKRSVDRCRSVPLDDVDPTGAGDAFCASFVVAALRGDSLADCNRAACDTSHAYLASKS